METNTISLLHSLNNDLVAAKVKAEDRDEAIALAGRLLMNSGLIRESYITAMQEIIRELGPYCVVAPGIAMPHARPEDGVLQTGFSLVTLETPIKFGNLQNDPVDIVIGFAALDKTRHILALKEIASQFSNPEFVQGIRNSRSTTDLIKFIQSSRKKL